MPSNVISNILELIKYRVSSRLETMMPLMLGQSPASLETSFLLCIPTRIHAKIAADLTLALCICSVGLVLLNVFSTDYCTQACHTELVLTLSRLRPSCMPQIIFCTLSITFVFLCVL